MACGLYFPECQSRSLEASSVFLIMAFPALKSNCWKQQILVQRAYAECLVMKQSYCGLLWEMILVFCVLEAHYNVFHYKMTSDMTVMIWNS